MCIAVRLGGAWSLRQIACVCVCVCVCVHLQDRDTYQKEIYQKETYK